MDVGGELDLRIDPKLATQVFVSSSSNPKDLVWGIRCSIKETSFWRRRERTAVCKNWHSTRHSTTIHGNDRRTLVHHLRS